MKLSFGVVMLVVALAACRDYDLESRLTDQSGLVAPDRFARYGREQAQEVAIAREYGHARESLSAEDLALPAETATGYARTLPDVIDARADPLGFRLTIHFKSGWLTMVTPVVDGKRGAETAGVPAEAGSGTGR
jgi:hypothetical protein